MTANHYEPKVGLLPNPAVAPNPGDPPNKGLLPNAGALQNPPKKKIEIGTLVSGISAQVKSEKITYWECMEIRF